jgi:hypothetical protein
MPHFKELLDPNFLSNIDFINDKMKYDKKLATIESVQRETTHNGKGGDETVTTLHFKECKPLILSNRNFKTILRSTKLVNTDQWKGIVIELTILENVKAFGQLWDVVRIGRVTPPATSKPVDYTNQIATLRGCTTLENLQFEYTALDRTAQAALVKVKDEMKKKLTPGNELQMLPE